MDKRGGAGKIFFVFLFLVLIVASIYFSFFFYYTCEDSACFKAHQAKCSKTKFINTAPDAIWEYYIGQNNNYLSNVYLGSQCDITVTLLALKKGDIEVKRLEGLSMICSLPKGSTNAPDGDINNCHGLLKEEMQNTIIQKLHTYIVGNIGQVSDELNKAV